MSDFDALLAAVMFAIVLGSVLALVGVLKVDLKRPTPTQPRTRKRRQIAADAPPSGPPMTSLPPTAPKPGGADDYQARPDAP